jgi:Uma2 family endonuclease
MNTHEASLLATERIRPLKRVEFDRLAADGCFDDEDVELLFGVVVERPKRDPAHDTSIVRLHEALLAQLRKRAEVRNQSAFAASEISQPLPHLMVIPVADYWTERPSRAFLVIEVSNTSLARDRDMKARLYATSDVAEYWIVDLADRVVEVRRARVGDEWTSVHTYQRGERVTLLAFPDVTIDVSDVVPPG